MAKAPKEDVIYDAAEGKVAPATKAAKPAKEKYDLNNLNTLAVVSLATAVTGFGAAAAVITGHISLSQIKRSQQGGRAMAIAGLAAGYTVIGLWILSTLGFVALSVWGVRNGIGPIGGFDDHMREGQGFGFERGGDHGGQFQMEQGQIQVAPGTDGSIQVQ